MSRDIKTTPNPKNYILTNVHIDIRNTHSHYFGFRRCKHPICIYIPLFLYLCSWISKRLTKHQKNIKCVTQKVDILMAQNRNGSHVKTPSMSRKITIKIIDLPLKIFAHSSPILSLLSFRPINYLVIDSSIRRRPRKPLPPSLVSVKPLSLQGFGTNSLSSLTRI